MDRFEDGAHVPALITGRPARGIIAIPLFADLPWQALFIAALRNQCLTWGGQGNLPVPWTDDTANNPLFWRLVEAQDPDLIISAPMSWADLEDLLPERHAEQAAAWRTQLEAQGHSEKVIEVTIRDWAREPIKDRPGDVGAAISKQLIDRAGLLHWKDHVETNVSLARNPASGLCVDVRQFWKVGPRPIDVPLIDVSLPVCDGSSEERLAICALTGHLSRLVRAELDERDDVVLSERIVNSGYPAVRDASSLIGMELKQAECARTLLVDADLLGRVPVADDLRNEVAYGESGGISLSVKALLVRSRTCERW